MFFSRLCVAGAFSRNKYALGHHNSAQKREWPGTVITFLDRVRGRYNSKKGRQNCSNPPEKETEYRQTAQRNGGSETLRSLSARRLTGTTYLCTYYFFSYNSFGEYQGYTFYDSQGNPVSSQTIRNGERLIAPYDVPSNPNSPGAEFKGWYVGDDISQNPNLASEPFDFEQPQNIGPDDDNVVYLYAVFTDYAYVTFHGRYDSETQTDPVLKVVRTELSGGTGTLDFSNVKAANFDEDSHHFEFYGWAHNPFHTPSQGTNEIITGNTLQVDEDTDLYPVYKQVHRLQLASGYTGTSATYFSPVSVAAGGRLTQSDIIANCIPERPGYAFQGWYLGVENAGTINQNGSGTQVIGADGTLRSVQDNEKGIQAVAGDEGYLMLSTDVTLYARWEAVDVNYTIVVWRQRTTDDSYDWAESFVLQEKPYVSVTVPEQYRTLNVTENYNALHDPDVTDETNPYAGYTFGHVTTGSGKDEAAAEITAAQAVEFKGTTVFNLYYDRSAPTEAPSWSPHTITFVYPADCGLENGTAENVAAGTELSGQLLQPVSKTGFDFAWYLDETHTKAVSGTMPDHDLTVYGGWTKQHITIHIDTDYGALWGLEGKTGTGATYFKIDYGEAIEEYSHVKRDYAPSESGQYYYVNHDWDYGGDRKTYYTTDVSKATELTTFKYAPGTYIASEWFVQEPDGSETRFNFARQSTYAFHTHLIGTVFTLKLHWKLSGTYYLQYNADVTVSGDHMAGTLNDGALPPSTEGYTDQAEIVLTNSAIAPEGYSFVGWTVRGDSSGKMYYPGGTFTLPGELAVTVNGKKTVYLDAVYEKIKTATIIYEANGGTVSDNADAGGPIDNTHALLPSTDFSVSRDMTNGTVTVSGIVNNSPVLLSSGAGFVAPVGSNATLTGWNTKRDGSGTHYALGSYEDGENPLYVDIEEPVTLYAEWQITVYINKNDSQYPGAEFTAEGWDGYTLVNDSASEHYGEYSFVTYVHAKLAEPDGTVETTNGLAFDFWSTRSDGDQSYAFDFNTGLSGEQRLYAHLTDAVKIPYHVVSDNKVLWDSWRNTDTLRVTTTPIDLSPTTTDLSSYVTPEPGYSYVYACLNDTELVDISGAAILKEVKLDGGVVKVVFENDTEITLNNNGKDDQNREIYLVYRTDKDDNRIKLSYVKEGSSGALSSIENGEGMITYNGSEFSLLNASLVPAVLNSKTVANGTIEGETVTGQVLTLSETPLEISQRSVSGVFNAPPLLDDPAETDLLTLVYDSFGIGVPDTENSNRLAGFAQKLYLRYYDGKRQWSLDGNTWTTFSGSTVDTLYVVYRQRGFELEITKSVVGDNTGISPSESFAVTITSAAITRSSYPVEGTGYSTISATPASGGTPGSIKLTVKDGSDIHITGLGSGVYTITETHNTNFNLMARVDSNSVDVIGGESVTVSLTQDRLVELLNVPYPICQILDTARGGYQQFYTLNRALEYTGANMDGEAEIQMLRDYVMPGWDALEIPAGYDITLTSASGTKTITRASSYTPVMLTNYGTSTLKNIALDGASSGVTTSIIRNLGVLTIDSGAAIQNANRPVGFGSAIYQDQGELTINDGASFTNNHVATNGGAIYVESGLVTVSGGTFSNNGAGNGAVIYYAGNDAVTVSGGSFSGNAVSGNGGVIYASGGSLTLSGSTNISGNTANEKGGAIYSDSGTVTVSGGTLGGTNAADANSAQNGGAIYSASGAVTISGGSITGNRATTGNGGAICSDAGTVTISGGTLSTNTAANGNGGAIYVGTGSIELSAGVIGGSDPGNANSAQNGAGIFVNTGSGTFTGGTVTGNTATSGGAVGVGSGSARLYFSGNVSITGNTMGGDPSNVYLDQDSEDVINITGLGTGAAIGIYVPDSLTEERGIPGAKFATYTNDTNKVKIVNDRDEFDVVSETAAKRLFWGKAITVQVRYQASYASTLPPSGTGYQVKKTINSYYPVMGDEGYVAISALAEDLYNNYSLSLGSATAAYGGAWKFGSDSFANYVTKLTWDTASKGWKLTKHDNVTTEMLGANTLIVYYAEPAYISIENNTDMALTVSDLTVGGRSVINTASQAGYGMVFAKNGAIRSALLPVESTDLVLEVGKSVNILIPGGRDMTYSFSGSFAGYSEPAPTFRRTVYEKVGRTYLLKEKDDFAVDPTTGGFSITGDKTRADSAATQLIFGEDKQICKIVTGEAANLDASSYLVKTEPDGNGKTEYVFKSLNQALDFVKAYMTDSKTAAIEMLTDYLLPASDNMNIPQGYNITLTTAMTGTYRYTATEKFSQRENKTVTESRATISRDADNKVSMFTVTTGNESTFFTLENLIIDGKSVQGSSDGGAVQTNNCGVTVKNADFLNIYAGNGGAIYAKADMGKSNSWVTVEDSYFYKCNSTRTSGTRLGGGAIHAFVNALTITNSDFYSCEAFDQAGAVFHRIDDNIVSSTTITGCVFSNCRAKAAGGLELDSKTITVRDCRFEHCVATDRNGGGFNVYALNSATPSQDCWVTVTGCSFEDCHATNLGGGDRYGGAFRSSAVYTTVENCSFKNTSALRGGAIGISSTNAKSAVVNGCTIDGGTASQYGGGIYCAALELKIGDYTDAGGKVTHTTIQNCRAGTMGGGIYHARNANNSTLVVDNATVSGNTAGTTGGGIDVSNVRAVTITGSAIKNNTANGNGGGIRIDSNANDRRLILDSSTVEGNVSGGQGGGIYANSQITLRNNTKVTDNRLTGNTAENAAGVYVINGRILTVGTEGASAPDATMVKDNVTAANAASDVRLAMSGSNNATNSVSVLCNLSVNSEIRVVNPGAAGTQFGTRSANSFTGFTEGQHAFRADSGELYGVYNRNSDLQLIWRGGAICKLTDESGHLLYLDAAGTDPAVFDRLDDRSNISGNRLSPFSYLRQPTVDVKLYRQGDPNPIDLTEEGIQVKLLVSAFETGTNIQTGSYTDRKLVTITTASSTDTDGYPYTGRAGSYTTIIRGYGSNNNGLPLINTGVNLTLRNITLDGGAADKTSPKTATASGGLIYANVGNTTVTIGANAVLQNVRISNSNNGGGVYLNNGASLTIAGGAIYNCSTASGQGGGVYKNGGSGDVAFSGGIISRCSAKQGGGVYFGNGSGFSMSGSAQITGCTATQEGGGVYLWEQRIMTMTGGSVTGNHAGTEGGGIFLKYHKDSRLNLSGRVTITGNTGGDAGYDCNVQLGTAAEKDKPINEWDGIINSLGITRNSLIGIYVPGSESTGNDPVDKNTTVFDKHGLKTKPFGSFTGDTNYLYCFVNDRNGLKGGLQIGDNTYIHWVEIFSLQIAKTVISGEPYDLAEEFTFKVTFSTTENGTTGYYAFNSSDANNCYFTYDDKYTGKTDDEGNPKTIPIVHGEATVTLKNGESITVDNLPAEIENGHVYYRVEEIFADSVRADHYTTTTHRSSNPSANGVLAVSGIIGENLNRDDVSSKYVSYAYFDNLNAICKLTSSKNGGVLLNTLDVLSGNFVPAVYSSLSNENSTGAFDVINAQTALYYYNSFTNAYERFNYSGDDTLGVEMLVGAYSMTNAVTISSGIRVTLTTAKSGADGYPYSGTSGTQAMIARGGFGSSSMFTANGNLTLDNIVLDGNKDIYDGVTASGGIVSVSGAGSLTIQRTANNGSTILRNSKTSGVGGAVYAASGSTVTMTGGTISSNTAGSGAGIYLTESAKLFLSGNPVFGAGTEANSVIIDGYSAKKNGTESVYGDNKVRQDVYVTETGNNPASIVISGALTGDPGSIWVWAESEKHDKTLTPFAVIDTTKLTVPTDDDARAAFAGIKVFRNARDDIETENPTTQNPQYLYGILKSDNDLYVYWYGIEGSARVMLVKVLQNGSSYQPLEGRTFTVYTDSNMTRVAKGTVINDSGVEVEQTLENLTSGAGGAFFIGVMSYGTYYVKEDGISTQHFEITIDDGGVVTVSGTGSAKTTVPVKMVSLTANS